MQELLNDEILNKDLVKSYIKRKYLLSNEEYFHLIETTGIKKEQRFKNAFNKIYNQVKELNPKIIFEDYVYNKNTLNEISNFNRYFKEYVFVNMLLKIIPYDNKFVEIQLHNGRRNYMEYFRFFYELIPIAQLPHFDEIEFRTNKKFAVRYFLLERYQNRNLDGEEIINLFLESYENGNNDRLHKKFAEFSNLFYPLLLNNKKLDKFENIIDYLSRKKNSRILDKPGHIYVRLNTLMEGYENTEFYKILKIFIDDKITKMTLNLPELNSRLNVFSEFSKICMNNKENPINLFIEITGYHLDLYIEKKGNKNIDHDLYSIKSILRFYNTICKIDKSINTTIIDRKFKNKDSNERDKTALKESGMGVLAACIYEAIVSSREKDFLIMSEMEIYHYLKLRCIWIILITGARMTEIRNLKLNSVQETLKYKDPYITLHTLKNGNDRNVIFRGENIDENGKYENDWMGFDILLESIKASESLYDRYSIDLKRDLYLFPSYRVITNKVDSTTLYVLLNKIQTENKIVYGSIYDILEREAYLTNPIIKKSLDKPLYTTHNFRHFSVEILRKYARLTQVEIMKFTGHRNPKSEEAYGEHFMLAVQTFKVLEDKGHTYGENKLLPNTELLEYSNELDIEQRLYSEDLEHYSKQVDSITNNFDLDAASIIDKTTNCSSEIACAETGIGCTSCNNFRSGEETELKRNAVLYLLKKEFEQIEIAIEEINTYKKELLKKKESSKKLLINKFSDVCYRFERIHLTKLNTLLSKETGFGWSESTVNRFIRPLLQNSRKIDIDKKIIERIKELLIEGEFNTEIDTTLYRDSKNKMVFKK